MTMFLFILAMCCPAWAAKLQVQVERDALAPGDNVTLEVQVIDGRVEGVPKVVAGRGLRVRYRGQGSSRSIINFKTTSVVRYSYQLTALAEGEWEVGPFELDVQGQILQHPALVIDVKAAEATGASPVEVKATMSDRTPYVGELVIYNLEFQRKVEAHNIRWTPPETPGFIAEPSAELAQRDRSQIQNGVEISVLNILLPLRATAVGAHTVSEAVLTADLPAPPDPRTGRRPVDVFGRYRLRSRSLPSTSIAIEVKPLPAEGRPADFSGLVGDFTLAVESTAVKVEREETVTLTVTLAGTGVLAGFSLPSIPDTASYRVYDDTPVVESVVTTDGFLSKATFKRAVVPLVEGALVIPPISVAIFDPTKEAYVTVSSAPLVLEVSPGVARQDGGPERYASGDADQRRDVEARGDDILPAPGNASIGDRTFARAVPLIAGLPLLPVLGGMLWFGRVRLTRRKGNPWSVLARHRVPDDPSERIVVLSWMFRQAASLRLGCAPSEVDRPRLEALGESVVQLYVDLEAARYGGAAPDGLAARVQAFVAGKGAL